MSNVGVFGLPPRTRRNSTDVQPPGGVAPANGWVEIIGNSNGSGPFVLNRESIYRFDLWVPTRVHYVGLNCSSVGTESAALFQGIRAMQMDGWPGPLIAEGRNDMTSTTGAGSKWATIGVDLPPGRYCYCNMATGWTTTAPQARGTTTTSDQGSYPYSSPHGGCFPVARSVGLPGAGNRGWATAYRTTDGIGLTRGAVRDWLAGSGIAAAYIDGEPI